MDTSTGETSRIRLRTGDTQLPWQYYQAAFQADGQRRGIDVPFAAFRPENLHAGLDPSRRDPAKLQEQIAGTPVVESVIDPLRPEEIESCLKGVVQRLGSLR